MQRKCDHGGCCEEKEVEEEAVLGWKSLVRKSWVENFLVGSTTAGGKTAEREQKKSLRKRSGSPRDELRVTITRNRGDLVER